MAVLSTNEIGGELSTFGFYAVGQIVPKASGVAMPVGIIKQAPPMLVVPEDILEVYADTQDPGFPARRMLRPTNNSMWKSASAQPGHKLTFLIGSGRAADVVALLNTNAPEGATIKLQAGFTRAQAEGNAPAYQTSTVAFWASSAPVPLDGPKHALVQLAGPQTYPWWCVVIGGAPNLQVTHLVAGKARRPARNHNRDATTDAEDLGRAEYTVDGALSLRPGARMRRVSFELVWIDETEYETMFAPLWREVGNTSPVLVVPNTAPSPYFHNRILYGNIQGAMTSTHQTSRFFGKNIELLSLT